MQGLDLIGFCAWVCSSLVLAACLLPESRPAKMQRQCRQQRHGAIGPVAT